MALTGKGHELECNTPEARLARIEEALIALGKRLDGHSYYGYEYEKGIRESLRREK